MEQIIAVVIALPGLDYEQMVGAIEFFQLNPDARDVFLKLPDYLQFSYVRRVGV